METASSDEDAVRWAPEALTFTATDWNTVTASMAGDVSAVDEREMRTHTVTEAAEYAGSATVVVVPVSA